MVPRCSTTWRAEYKRVTASNRGRANHRAVSAISASNELIGRISATSATSASNDLMTTPLPLLHREACRDLKILVPHHMVPVPAGCIRSPEQVPATERDFADRCGRKDPPVQPDRAIAGIDIDRRTGAVGAKPVFADVPAPPDGREAAAAAEESLNARCQGDLGGERDGHRGRGLAKRRPVGPVTSRLAPLD